MSMKTDAEKIDQIKTLVDLYFDPWGASKAARIEGELGDEFMFNTQTWLQKIREIVND